MTTESGVSSSQQFCDVIVSYPKVSALGHCQKNMQLISNVGLFLLLLCSSHLNTFVGVCVAPASANF